MAYVDREEVRLILKGNESESSTVSASSLSDEQIDAEIARVESEIDTALNGAYIVPFDPVPQVIKYIARDLAIYYSDLTFRMSNNYGAPLDPILLRYRSAKDILDKISAYKYTLNAETPVLVNADGINPYDGQLIPDRHLFGPAIYG